MTNVFGFTSPPTDTLWLEITLRSMRKIIRTRQRLKVFIFTKGSYTAGEERSSVKWCSQSFVFTEIDKNNLKLSCLALPSKHCLKFRALHAVLVYDHRLIFIRTIKTSTHIKEKPMYTKKVKNWPAAGPLMNVNTDNCVGKGWTTEFCKQNRPREIWIFGSVRTVRS